NARRVLRSSVLVSLGLDGLCRRFRAPAKVTVLRCASAYRVWRGLTGLGGRSQKEDSDVRRASKDSKSPWRSFDSAAGHMNLSESVGNFGSPDRFNIASACRIARVSRSIRGSSDQSLACARADNETQVQLQEPLMHELEGEVVERRPTRPGPP